MTGFWIAGIGINLAFFGALVWWAVRNWRSRPSGAREDRRSESRHSTRPAPPKTPAIDSDRLRQ